MRFATRLSLLIGCLSVAQVRAVVQTYNIANDFSTINNPNGVWSMYKAPGQLFTTVQSDWFANGSNQPAWADASNTTEFPPNPAVPLWAKAIGDLGTLSGNSIYSGFVDAGTVFMHSAEAFRTGTDFTTLVWTCTDAGIAHISGGLWIAKAFDRPHTWELRKNGAVFTSGSLSQSDPFTKSNPFLFATGSGGASAVDVPVVINDQIELVIYRPLGGLVPGTFVGMNYQIQVPEPAAATALLGLITITLRRRSRV
jgi:hypothetical protein